MSSSVRPSPRPPVGPLDPTLLVRQAHRSTVTGPKGGARLQAIDVDMEPMTDAFMTAVALAAVADGRTQITGIANQRVKECNRIEVPRAAAEARAATASPPAAALRVIQPLPAARRPLLW